MSAQIPPAPLAHLEAARILAAKHRDDVARELRAIAAALAPLDAPLVLLKGAAYAAAELPSARGRLFGDIDILVPKAALGEAERLLIAAGWNSANTDAYDQRYYRQWMHELPPLQHERRQTAIDVHHTIVPPTSRFAVDAKKLLDAVVPVGNEARLGVLAPADMVLHSAVHLFTEGEFSHGLRDPVRSRSVVAGFRVTGRGVLGSARRARGWLWPDAAALLRAAFRSQPCWARRCRSGARLPAPPALGRRAMDALLGRALRPLHPSCAAPGPAWRCSRFYCARIICGCRWVFWCRISCTRRSAVRSNSKRLERARPRAGGRRWFNSSLIARS